MWPTLICRKIGTLIPKIVAGVILTGFKGRLFASGVYGAQKPLMRLATVNRYPFRIVYRLNDETIDILHIRRTSEM